MDSVIFLGGRESSTIKEISENWLGKATIYMQTDGRSKGQSESYNLNTQRLGRELMTPSELATMPGDKCILQLRGRRPGLSEVCEVYEADAPDTAPIGEDEDILNYDDVDDPDAFV